MTWYHDDVIARAMASSTTTASQRASERHITYYSLDQEDPLEFRGLNF